MSTMFESDDEEVVLPNSELRKYMEINSFNDSITSEICTRDELHLSHHTTAKDNSSTVGQSFDNSRYGNSFKKPNLCSHSSAIIDSVLKTGLMYPDHVADIELYLNVNYIKPQPLCKTNSVIYSGVLLGSTASITLLLKKINTIHYISILAGSIYVCYQIYDDLIMFYQRKKVKHFVDVIGNLFSVTKRLLSFIFESEFLLKIKMVKEQPFYISDQIRWVNSNTNEGLKYSGLLLLEFRSILAEVYFDVIITFSNLTRYLRTEINLIPSVDCDNNYTQLPDNDILQKISVNPSLEDLKKLNSVYLIVQSEFLRRLVLSFVKDFWIKSKSTDILKGILEELSICVNKLLYHVSTLESIYERCLKISENKGTQIERNTVLNARNANDKILIFAKNLLAKADAHMLSLSLDLKMLRDWINECEKNNKESDKESKKLLVILLDRLVLMKSNIDLCTSLFNDNCNILKNVLNRKSSDHVMGNHSNTDQKSDESIQKTGIEVGKSDFDFAGEDEVLISLCNTNFVHSDTSKSVDDYEDGETQKCLPKNVLLELKYALKGKKEEWIEREKKALKSDISIDKLDFDTLSSFVAEDFDNVKLSKNYISKNCELKSRRNENNETEYSSDEESRSLCSRKLLSNSILDENESSPVFSKPNANDVIVTTCNQDCSDSKSLNESVTNNSSAVDVYKNFHSSFTDQIKFAQKSFNLSMKEEEFIGDTSDDESND